MSNAKVVANYQKVKTHLRENKKVYIATAAGVVVGAAGVMAFGPNTLASVKQVQFLTWKSKQTVEVFVEALGDPGNIVQDTVTGIVYASQGQAARSLGLNPSELSKHLTGRSNHVRGHSFVKLGKAAVSE